MKNICKRNRNGRYPLFEDVDVFGKKISHKELEEYRAETETLLTPFESSKRILAAIQNADFSKQDEGVLRQLANNEKMLARLIWVTDGSYRNNRIWIHSAERFQGIYDAELSCENRAAKDYEDSLEHLFADYDSVFIQLSMTDYRSLLMDSVSSRDFDLGGDEND